MKGNNIRLRIYPKVRDSIVAKEWREVSIKELKKSFKSYWPMLKTKVIGNCMECSVDDWFYNQYMALYDHQILKDGKWRSGI
jgi:hypothetical protein